MNLNRYIVLIVIPLLIISCGQNRIGEQQSLGLNVKPTTTATVETTPTPQGRQDDSADDPAIWINYDSPENSIVLGTDKKGGIGAYRLTGEEIAYYKVGKINNIDIVQRISFAGESYDILGGTNRSDNSIYFALISKEGKLIEQDVKNVNIPQDQSIYGFTMGKYQDALLAIANDKEGNIYMYKIDIVNNQLTAELYKKLKINSQPEGMVMDSTYGVLYIGEEEKGIWKVDLNDYSMKLLSQSQESDNEFLSYDIEGISIYPTNETEGYIIASSQGNNSYLVFDREGDNKYIMSFRVVDGTIDGIEETDGLDLVNFDFGPTFPDGFFTAQDGFNYDGKKKKSQNFKIVDWRNIQKLIDQYK